MNKLSKCPVNMSCIFVQIIICAIVTQNWQVQFSLDSFFLGPHRWMISNLALYPTFCYVTMIAFYNSHCNILNVLITHTLKDNLLII